MLEGGGATISHHSNKYRVTKFYHVSLIIFLGKKASFKIEVIIYFECLFKTTISLSFESVSHVHIHFNDVDVS